MRPAPPGNPGGPAAGRSGVIVAVAGTGPAARRPRAVRRGTAVITSFMTACGPTATPGSAGARSGGLECGAIVAFRATVKVT